MRGGIERGERERERERERKRERTRGIYKSNKRYRGKETANAIMLDGYVGRYIIN